MNFKEYNASQITPQLTLLKKFDKLLEWEKEHESDLVNKLYIHTITVTYTGLLTTPIQYIFKVLTLRAGKYNSLQEIMHDNFNLSKVGNMFYCYSFGTGHVGDSYIAYSFSTLNYLNVMGSESFSLTQVTFTPTGYPQINSYTIDEFVSDSVEEVEL